MIDTTDFEFNVSWNIHEEFPPGRMTLGMGQVFDRTEAGNVTTFETPEAFYDIAPVNDPPVFASDTVSLTVDENIDTSVVIHNASASDTDGDELTYSLAPE